VRAAGADSGGKCSGELRTRQPAVAADDQRVAAALLRQRAERLSDGLDDRRGQRLADDAANVVRLEDFVGKGHRSNRVDRRGAPPSSGKPLLRWCEEL